MSCEKCELPKWKEKIRDDYHAYLFGQSALVKPWEYKKENKLSEQISSILNRPASAPIWANEGFWKNQWPKIVDDHTNEVERTANLFHSRFAELKLAADYIHGRTIFYDI